MKKKVSLLIQLEFLFHIDNVVVPFSSVISPDADFGEFELFSEANFELNKNQFSSFFHTFNHCFARLRLVGWRHFKRQLITLARLGLGRCGGGAIGDWRRDWLRQLFRLCQLGHLGQLFILLRCYF